MLCVVVLSRGSCDFHESDRGQKIPQPLFVVSKIMSIPRKTLVTKYASQPAFVPRHVLFDILVKIRTLGNHDSAWLQDIEPVGKNGFYNISWYVFYNVISLNSGGKVPGAWKRGDVTDIVDCGSSPMVNIDKAFDPPVSTPQMEFHAVPATTS